jgi:hypothetical protein
VRRLLALALLLSAAACGGAGRLSRDEYARRADALCARYATALAALGRPTTTGQIVTFTARAAPLAQSAVDGARRLRPPRDEEQLARRWTAQEQKVADAFRRLGEAARRNDERAARAALAAGDTANTFADDLARQLGMTDCGRA